MTDLEFLQVAHRIQRTLLGIRQVLDIAELKEKDMPVSPQVATLIAEFDAATNAIAARIQTLVNSAGLSTEDTAALQAEVDKLTALGADPNNPIPAPTTGPGTPTGSPVTGGTPTA